MFYSHHSGQEPEYVVQCSYPPDISHVSRSAYEATTGTCNCSHAQTTGGHRVRRGGGGGQGGNNGRIVVVVDRAVTGEEDTL